MNPVNMLKLFIGNGGTPQQFLQNIAIRNPMIQNVIGMAKNGNSNGVENFARNLFKEKGRDFDKEFAEFRNQFK